MITRRQHSVARQRGVVLITALLLLIVVTLLAVSMFRSFGLDEKIAGNVREKQRALTAAETAEEYAEYWLASGNGTSAVTCTAGPPVPASTGQVCTAVSGLANSVSVGLGSPTSLPWPTGVTYAPTDGTNAMNVTTTPAQGSYYYTPMFYITYLGLSAGGAAKLYQIDATGFGGSPDTAAVVESTYQVQSSVTCLGCNQ